MARNRFNPYANSNINNRMQARFTVYGAENEDLFTEISIYRRVNSDIDTEIGARVEDESIKYTEINVMYGGFSEVHTELYPSVNDDTTASIRVNPRNRMVAIYEVQDPPILEAVLTPEKDSYTRQKAQYQTINYGDGKSLVVGSQLDDYYRTFIKFGLSNWRTTDTIISAKLRLHYDGILPPDFELDFYTVDEPWQEYGITDLNRPSPVRFITSDYNNNTKSKYIDVEFTDILNLWTSKEIVNEGLLVRASNEVNSGLAHFGSRESDKPPQLIVEYYDSRVYSFGRSQAFTELMVVHREDSETKAELEVKSYGEESFRKTEIYVHRNEVPVESEFDTVLTVTRPNIDTEITISLEGDSDLDVELSVAERDFYSLPASIIVSKPVVDAEIFVAEIDEVDAEITVAIVDDSDMDTELSVTIEDIFAEINVYGRSSVNTEIAVQRHLDDDRDVELRITRRSVNAEIKVMVSDENDVNTEVNVRAIGEDDANTELTVTVDSVNAEINISDRSDTNAEIYVANVDEINAELSTKVTSQVNTEIDVIQKSVRMAEISVTSNQVNATFTIPHDETDDVNTELLVRALEVSEHNVEIVVGSDGSYYVFIM